MPIYEYQCGNCGTRSEHLMRLSDPDPTECPGCETPKLTRMLSAPQFRLAGGGWYETDFKGDKDKKRNLAGGGDTGDGGGASKADAGTPAKAESKPEPKADATPAKPTPAKPSGTSSAT